MCDCINYLVKTVNTMVTETGITYAIFICENCKKYYIKRFNRFLEVKYKNNKWITTGKYLYESQ